MAELAQLQQHFADGLLRAHDAIAPHISSRLFLPNLCCRSIATTSS